MESRSKEIAAEQAYFDDAAKHRARRLEGLADLPDVAANAAAAAHLRKYTKAAAEAMGGAREAVAFGRIDTDDSTLYIGRHWIGDDRHEPLVINWHVPAAAPYFEANPPKPLGVTRKRTFECAGNTIQDFADILMDDLRATVDTFLLRELGRNRTGTMRDIVATIQAAQYDIIRAPMDQVLVIEGGPGTGKTAVALHRVSWLLYHRHADLRADGVLVVGPHPTFMHYIRDVLPGLGDAGVHLRDTGQLVQEVQRGRPESADVARLKGDARMASMLSNLLQSRIGAPEPVERLAIDGRFVSIPGADIDALLAECRAAGVPYAQRRALFRDRLADIVRGRARVEPDRQGSLANLVERLWPHQSPQALLRELFGSRRRLLAAAKENLTDTEAGVLYRRGADRLSEEVWSSADLPLLDELEHLINGTEEKYAHIVVDEAQDLSPMQLRSIARRSATGSVTVVGDIAQSTGPWARDSWDELTSHLPSTHPTAASHLRYGYRVPREAYEFAARLLPVAAPAVSPPEVIRDGPADPMVHQVHLDERAGSAVAIAVAHASEGRFVGLVCPTRCRREVEAALTADGIRWSNAQRGELGSSINLLSPQEAKGLEFDAVVVVEPEHIVAEYERGHRMLYVALTRTTGYLDIVCVGEPLPLSAPSVDMPDAVECEPAFGESDIHRLAAHVAAQMRSASPRPFWDDVLAEAKRLLDESES